MPHLSNGEGMDRVTVRIPNGMKEDVEAFVQNSNDWSYPSQLYRTAIREKWREVSDDA